MCSVNNKSVWNLKYNAPDELIDFLPIKLLIMDEYLKLLNTLCHQNVSILIRPV